MPKAPQSSRPSDYPLTFLSTKVLTLFGDRAVVREYQPGDYLLGPGSRGEEIRFLLSGKASVVFRDEENEGVAVSSLSPGDLFGGIEFFFGVPWSAGRDLMADEPCKVLGISPADFESALTKDPDFNVALVKSLVRKTVLLDRNLLEGKHRKRALTRMISRGEHVFPEYILGDYARKRLASKVEQAAKSDAPVLIAGEAGVGKEGLAHQIYLLSHQCKELFLPLDLHGRRGDDSSLIQEDINTKEREAQRTVRQERLFFGSEEPGLGGRMRETAGYFELAAEGTLLVRGVENLTRTMQLKLLEALVTHTYRRQGSVRHHKARVRLMATTRLDPARVSMERHPLIYALNDQSITIPPLRTRRREIPPLAERYLKKYSGELPHEIQALSKETVQALVNYSWPGNDQELANSLKRASLVAKDGIIGPRDISFQVRRVEGKGKLDLLRFQPLRKALTSPLYPAILQSATTPFLFILLAFLFLGPSDPTKNPAALFGWALGWPIMIGGALLWARFWCTLCPIGALAEVSKKVIAFERPFPAVLRNHSDFLIAGAVLFIIWFETATGIRNSPIELGLLLLTMLLSAVAVSVIFERQSWCLYLCGLGGMLGVLSKTSLLELRADHNVCISKCVSNECYNGSDTIQGCPFGQSGPKLLSNRLCKLCGKCLKSCPHGAFHLNVRTPGREIWEDRNTKPGTAFLVVGLVGGLCAEMLTRFPVYEEVGALWPSLPVIGLTAVFVAVIAAVNLLLVCASFLSHPFLGQSFTENYAGYGVALLPLALMSFMAFHIYYFINVGVQLPMLVSESFNFTIFRHLVIHVPAQITQGVQQTLIWIGAIWSILIISALARHDEKKLWESVGGMVPHAILAAILAVITQYAMSVYFYGA